MLPLGKFKIIVGFRNKIIKKQHLCSLVGEKKSNLIWSSEFFVWVCGHNKLCIPG